MKQVDFRKLWDPQVNRIGKMTLFPAVILCFLPVIYLYFVYGLYFEFSDKGILVGSKGDCVIPFTAK